MNWPPRPLGAPRSQRGAASVEAAIVIPVFVLIFAAVWHFAWLYRAKHAVLMDARTQAWQRSANACQGGPATKNARGQGFGQVDGIVREASAKDTNGVTGLLDEPLALVFGESVETSSSKKLKPPVVLGMKTVTVSGKMHLVCNLKPRTLSDVALDLWKKVGP